MREFGDNMQAAIDEAAGSVDRSQELILAFLARPTSLLDAVAVMGAVLRQLRQARAALAQAEAIRHQSSPRRQAALRREAGRRNGNMD